MQRVIPVTKQHVNVHELDEGKTLIEEMILLMSSLLREAQRFVEFFGLFSEARLLRNAIKENACQPLANALVSDLSAILKQYRAEDRRRRPIQRSKALTACS